MTMATNVETSALQAGLLRLLAAEINEWTLEEVLTKTEALRIRLGLQTDQLQAAICGQHDVVVLIAGGVADAEMVMGIKRDEGRTTEELADDELGEVKASPMRAPDFLRRGLSHMEDRAIQYDAGDGERSMASTVEAFNAVTGCDLSEVEGWIFMSLLKIARSQKGGPFKADNSEDLAAYAGLAGEAAARRQRLVNAGLGAIA